MTEPKPHSSLAQEVIDGLDKRARDRGTTVAEQLKAAYDTQLGSKAVRSAERGTEAPEK